MNSSELQRRLVEVWVRDGEPTQGGVVVRDYEVAHVLVRMAEMMADMPCVITDCPACNIDHSVWWEWSNSLAGPIRIRMQNIMRRYAIPFPPCPWEEVPTNAVPTALN